MTAFLDFFVITGIVLVDALLLAGTLVLAIYVWRQLTRRQPRADRSTMHSSGQIALEILQERYDRGEIDATEFEGRRAHLSRER